MTSAWWNSCACRGFIWTVFNEEHESLQISTEKNIWLDISLSRMSFNLLLRFLVTTLICLEWFHFLFVVTEVVRVQILFLFNSPGLECTQFSLLEKGEENGLSCGMEKLCKEKLKVCGLWCFHCPLHCGRIERGLFGDKIGILLSPSVAEGWVDSCRRGSLCWVVIIGTKLLSSTDFGRLEFICGTLFKISSYVFPKSFLAVCNVPFGFPYMW